MFGGRTMRKEGDEQRFLDSCRMGQSPAVDVRDDSRPVYRTAHVMGERSRFVSENGLQ